MESKHTPGPWHTGGKDNSIIYAEDGYAVANAVTYHNRDRDSRADAELIAAAPELLAALERVEARLTAAARAFYVEGKPAAIRKAFDGWKDDIEPARDALNKAKGASLTV